ncbi:uncharacterized protein PGTG_11862 [Puccinia graminis f. sp. tritici CRL 75-36-700-3]|uniref:Uncharacterized protein n=1 Tax=Puccinia graminis f. sp. tritici (strain CRL 75-36-700-3 / race SCCL) TaxID=418459 RepID=E3KMI1_PUCGT|nr:uncharacterized protein PGTG_11862 [Puccinia graminis f. sp. tritici CRL 75-36-700-3]EFP85506.2 hypothetical protein PGTG_11862 [Puccinia graminis f. sp. tritici CRL 75-36-700-3]
MSVVVSSASESEYQVSNQSPSPAPDTPGPRSRVTTQSSTRESQTGALRPSARHTQGDSDQSPSPPPDTPGPHTRVTARSNNHTRVTAQSNNREAQTGPIRPAARRTHGNGGRLPARPQRGASTTSAAPPARGASRPRPANLPAVPSRARPAASSSSTRRATAIQAPGNEADPQAVRAPGNEADPQAVQAPGNEADPQGAWPPATVHLTLDDEPINDEFISEVDAIFQLGGPYADLGEQLAYVPLPRQYVVGMYGLLSVRQAIERLRHDILNAPRGRGAQSAAVSTVFQAENFHYVAVFSEKINEQSDEFKIRYLPRGYSDPDPAAQRSVTTYVRGKLRNSRGKMRDLLLTNINMRSELPVPTISSLLTLMRSSLIPPLPNNAPATDTTAQGRRDYALLKARAANTDQHSFYQLVTRYDRELFGGEVVFSNIDRDSIALPTHEDIEALVASNAGVDIEAVADPGEDV